MTVDKTYPKTHFTEILADGIGGTLYSYARMGASNFTIRLQIDEAIKQRADLVLIGFTSSDRIDVPLNGKTFCWGAGIENIEYSPDHILPDFYNQELATCRSNPISNYSHEPALAVAIKHYVSTLYDEFLKKKADWYIVESGLYALKQAGIPFLFTRGGLMGTSDSDNQYLSDWINYETVDSGNPWNFVCDDLSVPASGMYHTSFAAQKDIADIWTKQIDVRIL